MKKGQTALEYLMTYGWAILIIVVVVAALFAMNVFNPSAWTGETASGFASFKVDAFSYNGAAENGIVNFTLGNQLGSTITITSVSVTESSNGTEVTNSSSIQLGPNGEIEYSINETGLLPQGSQYSVDVGISYTWQGQSKFDNGVLSGKAS